jgi:hypothetical protein
MARVRSVATEHRFVLIDHHYDDDLDSDEQPPWPRLPRWPDDPSGWIARCEYGGSSETVVFAEVDDAIAWGRERAEIVLVRLGTSYDTWYSAGAVAATQKTDGTGKAFLLWPPDRWPDYQGPAGEDRAF